MKIPSDWFKSSEGYLQLRYRTLAGRASWYAFDASLKGSSTLALKAGYSIHGYSVTTLSRWFGHTITENELMFSCSSWRLPPNQLFPEAAGEENEPLQPAEQTKVHCTILKVVGRENASFTNGA